MLKKNRQTNYMIAILILLMITLLFYPHLFVFILKDNKTLSVHFMLPGEGFTLQYNHSVEKTPVQEIYYLKLTGGFVMDKTIFQSHGAGLPLESKNFSIKGDKFIIEDMDIQLSELRIRVARTPGQVIRIKNTEYYIQNLARPGELIVLRSGNLYNLLQLKLFSIESIINNIL